MIEGVPATDEEEEDDNDDAVAGAQLGGGGGGEMSPQIRQYSEIDPFALETGDAAYITKAFMAEGTSAIPPSTNRIKSKVAIV